jgi:hypothetical protein
VGFEIDHWLDQSLEKGWKDGNGCPPHFSNKTTYRALLKEGISQSALRRLIRGVDARIRGNFDPPEPRSQSGKNWRFNPLDPHCDIGSENSSPEVCLEREIVSQSKKRGLKWENQSPVASGLLGPATDRRRAVDLVHEIKGDAHYDLIELKWRADNPFFAAMEIICYGLVYLLFRGFREKFTQLDTPLLKASAIGLRVLAPSAYYDGSMQLLPTMQSHISDAIRAIAATAGIDMDFRFLEIPDCQNSEDVAKIANTIIEQGFREILTARVTKQGG